MPALHLRNISYSYVSNVTVLSGVDLHLSPGWTGVVGGNGSGKSTLLALIAAQLRPDEGQLIRDPQGLRVHSCPQRADLFTPEVESYAYAWDRLAVRLRGLLRLDVDDVQRWETLSPGERKRWQVGAALWAEPDVLLLDEPSNHLDADGRALLLDALTRFSGIGLVVSHDRALLDVLTTQTIRVWGGDARQFAGNYSAARASWEADLAKAREQSTQASRRVAKVSKRLAHARRDRATAAANVSAGARMKGPKDHDARTMAAKNRVLAGEKRLSRQVELLGRDLERAREAKAGVRVEKERGRSLFAGFERTRKSRLARVELEELVAGDRVLARDVRLVIGRNDRIHLVGPNGAGKTTLLQEVMRSISLPRERVLFVPQELRSQAEASALIDEIRGLVPETREQLCNILAALGVDPSRALGSASPSPGEIRKMELAWGLGRHVPLVVLDEPTNHLDLPSIERLEAALAAYPGAVLVVSHDAEFARSIGAQAWDPFHGERWVSRGTASDDLAR